MEGGIILMSAWSETPQDTWYKRKHLENGAPTVHSPFIDSQLSRQQAQSRQILEVKCELLFHFCIRSENGIGTVFINNIPLNQRLSHKLRIQASPEAFPSHRYPLHHQHPHSDHRPSPPHRLLLPLSFSSYQIMLLQ